jgi:hypothetical protein
MDRFGAVRPVHAVRLYNQRIGVTMHKPKKETFLHIRCEDKDKQTWKQSAKGNLSAWIVKVLNNEAKKDKSE